MSLIYLSSSNKYKHLVSLFEMYNGIGLATVRGSATSGYVQKNLSHVRPEFFRNKIDANTGKHGHEDRPDAVNRRANPDILEHNKKHAIEAKVFELQEQMEEHGYSESEIAEKVAQLREKLSFSDARLGNGHKTDSHAISKKKQEENERARAAFGIDSSYEEGDSFNAEKLEARKLARLEERVVKTREAEERRLQREKEEKERRVRREAEDKERAERRRVGRGRSRSGDRRRGDRSRSGARRSRRDHDRSGSRSRDRGRWEMRRGDSAGDSR